MLAIVAAVFFLIALIFQLAGVTLGPITVTALVIVGLLCMALDLAGIGHRAGVLSRR